MCICLDSLVMEEKAQSEGRMARARNCLLLSIVKRVKKRNKRPSALQKVCKFVYFLNTQPNFNKVG